MPLDVPGPFDAGSTLTVIIIVVIALILVGLALWAFRRRPPGD